MGWGWGANGGLIDEIAAKKPHPPPDLPLEGGGVDAYGIHAIALAETLAALRCNSATLAQSLGQNQ